MAGKMPEDGDFIKKPQDRDKCLSVALFRLTGSTQTQAAELAGCDPCTVRRWEKCSWWTDIQAEASRRWLQGLEAKARRTLEDGMDAGIALKILERRLPELAPAKQHTELFGPDQPLTIRVVYDDQ